MGMPDSELAGRGATSAWQRAFEDHYAALLRLAVLVTGDRGFAEDLVQEAFVRVATRLETVSETAIRSYLRTSMLNVWRNGIRRRAVERRHARHATDPSRDPFVPIDDHELLWHAVMALPPRQRACLVLRYYEELTERDTGRALGISTGTVKSQIARALRRLREEVGDGY